MTHVGDNQRPTPHQVNFPCDTTTDSRWPPITRMQGRQKALPNQLFDPGKRSVNTRPTLCSAQPFLDVALFEWRESKGAVCARAQLFGADGLLAHQGRRGRCDEDLILAAVWIVSRLLTLFLQKKKVVKKIKKVLLINFFTEWANL